MSDEMRRSAFALAAGLAVVVLVAVVALLNSGRPTDAPVAVSPTPSPTDAPPPTSTPPPSPTPSPTATPAAVLDDRFGFVISDSIVGPRPAVRRESDPRPVFIIGEASGSSVAAPGAISPDGRRLAYWTTTIGSSDGLPQELRILEVAPDARPRTLLTLTTPQVGNKEFGGSIVWSSDGTGLVVGVTSYPSNTVADAPPDSVLRLLDAAGGQPREIVRIRGALVPLAWDRQLRLVAAYEPTSGGAGVYDIIEEGGKLDRSQVAAEIIDMIDVQASHDAQQMLGRGLGVLRVWPLASAARAVELRPAGGERILAASWRPGTAEIGVLLDDRIELWTASGARRPVPLPSVPPTSTGGQSLVFRADGSAVFHCRVLDRIVATSAGDRPDVYCVAVELATGRSAVVSSGGFFPGASVRIGP
jgi:hypothetical protein